MCAFDIITSAVTEKYGKNVAERTLKTIQRERQGAEAGSESGRRRQREQMKVSQKL